MEDRYQLNEENIREALRIYLREAYDRDLDEIESKRWPEDVLDMIRLGDNAEMRIGLPGNLYAKFRVWAGSYLNVFLGENDATEYLLSVDPNILDEDPEEMKQRSLEYKRKIEDAWKKEGFPVLEKRSETKS
jgi:hypothetical protein